MVKINKVLEGIRVTIGMLILTGSIYGVMLFFSSILCSATSYPSKTTTALNADLSMNQYKLTDVGDIITKGPWVDVRAYASFSAAIDAIGTTKATLLIPNTQTVSANKTVPSNIVLKFLRAGILDISTGVTVTINGGIEAGLYQIFSGIGTVTFGTGIVKEVYPEWWGAKGDSDWVGGGTDDSAAIQSAINAHRHVVLSKAYKIDYPLTISQAGTTIEGIDRENSGISPTGSPSNGINGFNISADAIKSMTFKNFNLTSTKTVGNAKGFNITGYAQRFNWENMMFSNWAGSSIYMQGGLNCSVRGCYFTTFANSGTSHIIIVMHPTLGAPTTFLTEGNYFAYGGLNTSHIIIEDIDTYTSLSDIFENAAYCMDMKRSDRVTIINLHHELITVTPIAFRDVTQGVIICGTAGVTPTWVTTPAEQRYVIQIGTSGYGEIRGIAGISKANNNNSYNLRGRVVILNGAGSANVSFAEKSEPDADYFIALSSNINQTFWVTGKSAGGFTINRSSTTTDVTVEWILVR